MLTAGTSRESVMSRAFVKENDGEDFAEDLPERPVSTHPNLVTPRGLDLIEAEFATHRQALAAAQAAGDRTAIARAGRELRYWTARRTTAHLVGPPTDASTVGFGVTVAVERDDGRRQTFRIVGEDEADPSAGLISWISPLAQALNGKEPGDVVAVPGGKAELLEIRLDD
jgi:transcription elongation GreA/GreB family factor